jgi:tRNA A37 N6-isopentenylltransferase MiaA
LSFTKKNWRRYHPKNFSVFAEKILRKNKNNKNNNNNNNNINNKKNNNNNIKNNNNNNNNNKVKSKLLELYELTGKKLSAPNTGYLWDTLYSQDLSYSISLQT